MPRSSPQTPATKPHVSVADQARQRDYLRNWQRTGAVLEGIQFWELRYQTEAERAAEFERILAVSTPGPGNGPEGWIEWQKVKERWRKQQQH